MIEDRHMAVGSWSLDLVPDCPRRIRDEFRDGARGQGHRWRTFVAFFESDVHGWEGVVPQSVIDEMAEQAIWVGPVWERGNKLRHVAGPGLAGALVNDRGSCQDGAVAGPEDFGFPLNFTQFMQAMFPATGAGRNGVRLGGAASANLSSIDARIPGSYLPPIKEPLDELAAQTGNEWYIRPANRINWGDAESLFEYPPKVLCMEGMSTPVPGYVVLQVPADGIQSSSDIYGLINTAKVISEDYDLATNTGSGFANDGSVNMDVATWPEGGSARWGVGFIRADTNDFSDVTAIATVASEVYSNTNRVITVTANDPCVLASIRPGDWVAIYSPDDDIVDTDNELMVAGQPIHPEWLRSVAVHQPFNPGMGAYVCRYAPTATPYTWGITRITDYIADESGPCTIEIGSKPRPVVPSRYAKYIDG